MADEKQAISSGEISAFALPALFGAAMGLVAVVWLGKFYIDVVQVPAGLLALAIVLSRAFDALTDPLMGHISDHWPTRWGRRKPWIALGVVGNCVMFWLLLNPPESLTPLQAGWWCLAGFVLSFLFVTISYVPRTALAVELTQNQTERQNLFVAIAAAAGLGAVIGALMPTILAAFNIWQPREQLSWQAGIYIAGFALANLWLLARVRERPGFLHRGEVPFVPGVRRAWRNRAVRIMFLSHVITAIPITMPAALLPFFSQYVLGVGQEWVGYFVLVYLLSGLLSLPLWAFLALIWGKKTVWMLASAVAVTGGAALFFAGPGDTGYVLGIHVFVGMQSAVWLFIGGAMHADVVDYDELLTGKRREAQFSALWGFIPKFALIPGAALPIAVLGAAGYVPNAAEQSPTVLLWLSLLYALVPAGINAVGLSIMWWYPLTEDRHDAVREGVMQHAAGEAAVDPITGQTLAPPMARPALDDDGWFLDHFSTRELALAMTQGSGRGVQLRIALRVLAWGLLTLGLVVTALASMGVLTEDPGPWPSLALFGAGLALAGLWYQVLRLRPAADLSRRLGDGALDTSRLRQHCESA